MEMQRPIVDKDSDESKGLLLSTRMHAIGPISFYIYIANHSTDKSACNHLHHHASNPISLHQ